MAEAITDTARTACPLCDGSNHVIVGRRDRDGSPLTSAMCRSCGHVFTIPRPTNDELNAYYATKYRQDYKGIATPKAKHVWRAGQRALERLAQLETILAPGSRVLDIGAGGGEFAYLCAKAGYDVQGIEPHEGYALHARNVLGISVFAGAFQAADFAPHSFDAVTLHHVFEHLPEPKAALKQVRQWLKPGGVLMIEVPNVASWYHAPRRRFHRAHVQSFNRAGLEDVMINAGFAVASSTLTPHTQHLNVVARRGEHTPPVEIWRDNADEVLSALQRHTPFAHLLSGRPLRRLWANIQRPVREQRALRHISDHSSARAILDHVFSRRGHA